MTEDEAKKKWCPFSRQVAVVSREVGASVATANRDSGEHYGVQNVNCIGSQCMAWTSRAVLGLSVGDCRLMREIDL